MYTLCRVASRYWTEPVLFWIDSVPLITIRNKRDVLFRSMLWNSLNQVCDAHVQVVHSGPTFGLPSHLSCRLCTGGVTVTSRCVVVCLRSCTSQMTLAVWLCGACSETR